MHSWVGPPEWNGKVVAVELLGTFIPMLDSSVSSIPAPLMLQIEGCKDFFLPVFSTEEKLHEVIKQIHPGVPYEVITVDENLDSKLMTILEKIKPPTGRMRLMYDPEIINNHHTRWKEVIKEGDQWKYSAHLN